MSRALWHISRVHSEIRPVTRTRQRGALEVRALYSLVSTGTERLVARGEVNPGCRERMSVPYMEGSFDLPIKYGYSLVGTTEEGRLVHCMHPHQSTAFVAADGLTFLPETATPARMALLSNIETVLTAIWDAGPDKLHDVAVCGFGNLGALLANTLRIRHRVSYLILFHDLG